MKNVAILNLFAASALAIQLKEVTLANNPCNEQYPVLSKTESGSAHCCANKQVGHTAESCKELKTSPVYSQDGDCYDECGAPLQGDDEIAVIQITLGTDAPAQGDAKSSAQQWFVDIAAKGADAFSSVTKSLSDATAAQSKAAAIAKVDLAIKGRELRGHNGAVQRVQEAMHEALDVVQAALDLLAYTKCKKRQVAVFAVYCRPVDIHKKTDSEVCVIEDHLKKHWDTFSSNPDHQCEDARAADITNGDAKRAVEPIHLDVVGQQKDKVKKLMKAFETFTTEYVDAVSEELGLGQNSVIWDKLANASSVKAAADKAKSIATAMDEKDASGAAAVNADKEETPPAKESSTTQAVKNADADLQEKNVAAAEAAAAAANSQAVTDKVKQDAAVKANEVKAAELTKENKVAVLTKADEDKTTKAQEAADAEAEAKAKAQESKEAQAAAAAAAAAAEEAAGAADATKDAKGTTTVTVKPSADVKSPLEQPVAAGTSKAADVVKNRKFQKGKKF